MFASVLLTVLAIGEAVLPPTSPTQVPLRTGDRIRVRHDAGLATITGSAGKTLDLSMPANRRPLHVRRLEGNIVEVTTNGPVTLSIPRSVPLETISSKRARVKIRGVHALKVQADSGNVHAEEIAGNVDASIGSADLTLRAIGGNVVASSSSGNISADAVRGLVDVTTGNGNTTLADIDQSVHVVSINGRTELSCVAGAIDVKDTSGRVTVRHAAGDVEIFTALGQAFYEGALQRDRSYRMRTLDGAVTLTYTADSAGFTGRITSDSGNIETVSTAAHGGRREEVRVGDESARVVLDAVGGRVALKKGAGSATRCK